MEIDRIQVHGIPELFIEAVHLERTGCSRLGYAIPESARALLKVSEGDSPNNVR